MRDLVVRFITISTPMFQNYSIQTKTATNLFLFVSIQRPCNNFQ